MIVRVVVTIDGSDYTVVSEESEEHIRTSAALVDKEIEEIKKGAAVSAVAATTLAAMNIASKYYKTQESADHLRNQVRDYAAENARLQSELAKAGKK